MPLMRLQRFLSQAGIASRREAEQKILCGQVRVNGVVAELGTKVDPQRDRVTYQKRTLQIPSRFSYLIFHKPTQVMVTRKDPENRKTVYQCIAHLDPSMRAVGRLDYDSEGLLLFTNDGELAYRLTHPSYAIAKVYRVLLDAVPTERLLQALEKGIELEGGEKTAPAKLRLLTSTPEIWVEIQIHEGKKRQVRRMFEWGGHSVKRLVRLRLGSLSLEGLQKGKWRNLEPLEVDQLRRGVGLGKMTPNSQP